MTDLAALLARKGQPLRRRLRSGLTLLADVEGRRRARATAARLSPFVCACGSARASRCRWPTAWGPLGKARLEDNGETLMTEVRIDRRSLVNGLFYGVDGMRVGGTRRLEISPHLAYGDRGVPGVIPPGAVLTAEITFLDTSA